MTYSFIRLSATLLILTCSMPHSQSTLAAESSDISLREKCDKWKGEWLALGSHGLTYSNKYIKFKSGDIQKAELVETSDKLIPAVQEIIRYVETTPSCPHKEDKFEKRRRLFLKVSNRFILAMRAVEFFDVKQHDDQSSDD